MHHSQDKHSVQQAALHGPDRGGHHTCRLRGLRQQARVAERARRREQRLGNGRLRRRRNWRVLLRRACMRLRRTCTTMRDAG